MKSFVRSYFWPDSASQEFSEQWNSRETKWLDETKATKDYEWITIMCVYKKDINQLPLSTLPHKLFIDDI